MGGAYVNERRPSLSAALGVARYAVRLRGRGHAASAIEDSLRRIAASETLLVPHKQKMRTFSPIAEVLIAPVVESDEGDALAHLTLRLGQEGSLRPDALVAAALEYSEIGAADLVVTRIELLEDSDGDLVDPLH